MRHVQRLLRSISISKLEKLLAQCIPILDTSWHLSKLDAHLSSLVSDLTACCRLQCILAGMSCHMQIGHYLLRLFPDMISL